MCFVLTRGVVLPCSVPSVCQDFWSRISVTGASTDDPRDALNAHLHHPGDRRDRHPVAVGAEQGAGEPAGARADRHLHDPGSVRRCREAYERSVEEAEMW